MLDPDKPDAPPKTYGFKPKEFERVNAPSSGESPSPSAKDLAMMAGGPAQRDPATVATPAKAGLPTAAPAKAGDPNDVLTILQENRRLEQQHGFDAMEIRSKKSRRKRDYWLVMIANNTVFGAVTAVGIAQRNPMLMAYGFAGVILVSIGVTWVMWFIMSDY